MLNNLKINKFEYPNFNQFYITLDLNGVLDTAIVSEEYSKVNKYLIESGIQVVYEKGFGQLSFKDKMFEIKRNIEGLNFSQWPFSYVEGKALLNSCMSSITIMGIQSFKSEVGVEYIELEGRIIGAKMIDLNEEYLYIMGLTSDTSNGKNEFRIMFEQLKELLNRAEFSEGEIVRTWIYLNDIKNNYPTFNDARRIFFQQNNIDYSSFSNVLPASTCIHGITDIRSTAIMDVMCIKKNESSKTQIDRIYTPLLNEAEGDSYLYKPTFSRALSIETNNHIEIQLSGTASVNQNGETVFSDPYRQIEKTLRNIESILSVHNLTFEDFTQSTCFFKSEEYYSIFQQVMQEMKIPHFSNTFVVGDICRQDLLCEIDGIIKKKKDRREEI